MKNLFLFLAMLTFSQWTEAAMPFACDKKVGDKNFWSDTLAEAQRLFDREQARFQTQGAEISSVLMTKIYKTDVEYCAGKLKKNEYCEKQMVNCKDFATNADQPGVVDLAIYTSMLRKKIEVELHCAD